MDNKITLRINIILLMYGRILMLKKQMDINDVYSIVSDERKNNENIFLASSKIMKEKIGLTIAADKLKIVQIMLRREDRRGHTRRESIEYFILATEYHGVIIPAHINEYYDIYWAEINSLPSNTEEYIKKAIHSYEENIPFSFYG